MWTHKNEINGVIVRDNENEIRQGCSANKSYTAKQIKCLAKLKHRNVRGFLT